MEAVRKQRIVIRESGDLDFDINYYLSGSSSVEGTKLCEECSGGKKIDIKR